MQMLNEELINKWKPMLDADGLAPITDMHRRDVTAAILENAERELKNSPRDWAQSSLLEAAPTNSTGSAVQNYDPILISLLRRAMPNLIAYDLCGVQAMTGPTGLIFAMRSRYSTQAGTENFYNEVDTGFASLVSGANTLGQKHVGTAPDANTIAGNVNTYNFGTPMATANAEGLGTSPAFPEMAFSIEKVTVSARSRALKAEYSMELAQDLKAIHGLDAETELANILTAEVLAEINREIVRTINVVGSVGAQDGTTTAGTFDLDTDSNGRWFGEKFKGLMFQIERECNAIAKATRRGKGNLLLCSSDVASALNMAGVLSMPTGLGTNLTVDDTGNTFAGLLNNRVKVYIDPYAGSQYVNVGYKGSNAFDAGLFYCPYVPLQMVRAVGQDSFQPKIGFKTRYGIVMNPFSRGATVSDGTLVANANVYYRKFLVANIF